jgi:tetratricopeptide (TPR) repeat protein
MARNTTTSFWLLLSIVGLLALAVYWPGTHGGFLFDDFATLPTLGKFGPIDNWIAFSRYVTSGGGDPTGRPVAMLSFLLDARNWPADPAAFKHTNLLLHVINGLLLAVLLRSLGRIAFQGPSSIDTAAVLASSYWMLQPLFVSTTLYIVQRETMLCTCFVLLGLLAWLRGRKLLLGGQQRQGLLWMILGLGGCTILAFLSKANGILLPALALCVEYVFLRSYSSPSIISRPFFRRAILILAVPPSVSVLAYLAYQGWHGFVRGVPSIRPWTLGQRLLTEPRVLIDYLQLLWLPRPFTDGIFNDQVTASVSLWMPKTTLPAILAVFALILVAWRYRRRCPAVALAILFYFTGQILESSTIPLELYFEHRNYLPAVMMYWPLCLWLCNVRTCNRPFGSDGIADSLASKPWQFGKLALAAIILLGVAWMTYSAATMWGNRRDQAILWAALNPDSPRAQTYAAIEEMRQGHSDHAAIRLRAALAKAPHEAQLALNLFIAECTLGHIAPTTLDATRRSLRTMRDNGPLLLDWFDAEIEQSKSPPCPELTVPALRKLIDAALSNPLLMAIAGRRQDLYHSEGQLFLSQKEASQALLDFNLALDQQPDAKTALNQAALLGMAGFPKEGLAHLDYYDHLHGSAPEPVLGMPRIHAWLLQNQHYWPRELARLRATLSVDALRNHQS